MDCLERFKSAVGDEHAHTFMAMSNLALSLSKLGKHQDALNMQQDTMDGQKRIFGDEHPRTLMTCAWNAVRSSSLRESFTFGEVRGGRKKILGEQHPFMFRAMENLADISSKLEERRRLSFEKNWVSQ
jgi:hypothetical protein